MLRTLTLLLFVIIVGCAPKVNYSFILPIPVTYPEERMALDKYPVDPVFMENLNAE